MLVTRAKVLSSRFIWLAVLPFFLGCAKGHNSPAAELGYLGLERERDTNLYKVRFSSGIDLLEVFEKGKRPIGSMLRCSLGVDEVSANYDDDQYIADGLVSVVLPARDGEDFIYSAVLMFDENLNEGRSTRMLSADELQHILDGKQFVPCVYTATAFGFKAYRSATMRVPVADILREVGIYLAASCPGE
ncbi:hypothetical protein ACIGKL_04345 [Pseudomonas sp. NPDC077186]|uniref:hypothetical protein n=1 Tax=Pseudomonas sp. NPDC077186 TaxID=3364421 RepID=UPI0037C4F90F